MKRRSLLILFLMTAALGLSSCAGDGGESKDASEPLKPTVIKASEAKTMMDASDAFILLDVRTAEEYREMRIDGAVLLPNDEINARAEEVLTDKTAPIFVYCRSGRRSAEASKKLASLGYENVYDFGGIIDWPYDTISG